MSLIEALENSRRFRLEVEDRQCALIGGAPKYLAALRSISEKIWFIDRHEKVEDLLMRVCDVFEWQFKTLVTANVNKRMRYFEEYSSAEVNATLREINQQDTLLYDSLALEVPDDRRLVRTGTARMDLPEKVVLSSSHRGAVGSHTPMRASASMDHAQQASDSLSLSIDEFVTSAYQAMLGRRPDPKGLRDRRKLFGTMPAARGAERILRELVNSKEFQERRDESQRIPRQIAVFTPAQSTWVTRQGIRPDRVLVACFFPHPGSRPTIHLRDHSLLTEFRVRESVKYIENLIFYYLNFATPVTHNKELFCVFQIDDRPISINKTIGYCDSGSSLTLIPDLQFWLTKGYFDRRQEFMRSWIPWRDRLPRAFWRGSSTGPRTITLESLPQLSRFRLCASVTGSAILQRALDAKLTDIVQAKTAEEAEKIKASLHTLGLLSGRVPQGDFLKYRFQIDIDGNSSSWGFLPKLMMGSCILKVISDWRQWYYDGLRPWEHYVPIKNDLADLEEQVAWCLDNDEQAREIGETGMKYANRIIFGTEMSRAAATLLQANHDLVE